MVDLPPLGGALVVRRLRRRPHRRHPLEVLRGGAGLPHAVLHDLEVQAARAVAMPIMPFCDLILSVFPVAWVFGRSGCSVVHDHQGMKAPAGTSSRSRSARPIRRTTIHLGPIELRYGNAPALRPRAPRDDVHRHPRDAASRSRGGGSSRPARTSRPSRSRTRPCASRWTSSASATWRTPTRATAASRPPSGRASRSSSSAS